MPNNHRLGPRDWAGRSAYALSIGLAIGWSGALLMAAFPSASPVSDTGANLLSTLGGAMAGAVATYLGSTLHARAHGDDRTRKSDYPREGESPHGPGRDAAGAESAS
jgi:hypothetical protein